VPIPSIPTPNIVITRGDNGLPWAGASFETFCQGLLLGFDLWGSVGFVILLGISKYIPWEAKEKKEKETHGRCLLGLKPGLVRCMRAATSLALVAAPRDAIYACVIFLYTKS
jgi:hypothetical protein